MALESNLRVFLKLKICVLFDPENSLPGIDPRQTPASVHRDIPDVFVIAAEEPVCPSVGK